MPGRAESDNDDDEEEKSTPVKETKVAKKPASADKAIKKFDENRSEHAEEPDSQASKSDYDTGSCFKLGKNILNISDEKMNQTKGILAKLFADTGDCTDPTELLKGKGTANPKNTWEEKEVPPCWKNEDEDSKSTHKEDEP